MSPLAFGTSTATGPVAYFAATTASHQGLWGSLDAPVVFEATTHFFVAAVPSVTVEPASGPGGPEEGGSHVTFGAGVLVGGAFGGHDPAPPLAEDPDEPTAPLRRFGSAGTATLDSELELYAHGTSYTGTPNRYGAYGAAFGGDYFVADHVSFGGGFSVTAIDVAGQNVATRNPYTKTDTAYAFFVRLGVEIPLGKAASLYPRASLGMEGESFRTDEGSATNAGSDSGLYASVYAPILVHVARHFFVGFGPDAYTDLGRTFSPGNQTINATSVGAGLTVGGWL
jgi:hypothetical protein